MGLGLGRRECCMKTIGSSMKGRCHPSTSDHHGPPLSSLRHFRILDWVDIKQDDIQAHSASLHFAN